MLAWSIGGLAVAYALTAFAALTGVIMVDWKIRNWKSGLERSIGAIVVMFQR